MGKGGREREEEGGKKRVNEGRRGEREGGSGPGIGNCW